MPRGVYNHQKGFRHTEATKRKLSMANTGKSLSDETKGKLSIAHKGKRLTEEHKRNLSRAMKGILKGENNPNWSGGISRLFYPAEWTETLKDSIRQRDGYVCQLCDKTQEEEGKKLSVHHIDYIKEHLDPENLTTLCNSCNLKVNRGRKVWMEYFQSKIRIRIPKVFLS